MPKYLFGKPIGKLVKTNLLLPLRLQRPLARPLPYIASGRMENYGLPAPNHHFLEAHPTVSSELLLARLRRRGREAERRRSSRATVLFEDGSAEEVDAIVYATGYNITFPFFDPGLLSAPDNDLPSTSGSSSRAWTTWR